MAYFVHSMAIATCMTKSCHMYMPTLPTTYLGHLLGMQMESYVDMTHETNASIVHMNIFGKYVDYSNKDHYWICWTLQIKVNVCKSNIAIIWTPIIE